MRRPHLARASTPSRSTSRSRLPKHSTSDILACFNTWAYKRERTSDPSLLEAFVAQAALTQQPISFVLYWGKGPREAVGPAEHTCLAYLSSMSRRIEEKHAPGASLHIIYTDTHARLNGHSEHSIEAYFADVSRIADKNVFRMHRLSEIVGRLPRMPSVLEQPDPETMERLQRCAAKWFRGEGSPDEGARRYFAMNMIEKRAIEHCFPASIFVTFNGSEYRSLFPERLPVFYMYSLKKGFAVKPWFIPGAPRPGEQGDRPPDRL